MCFSNNNNKKRHLTLCYLEIISNWEPQAKKALDKWLKWDQVGSVLICGRTAFPLSTASLKSTCWCIEILFERRRWPCAWQSLILLRLSQLCDTTCPVTQEWGENRASNPFPFLPHSVNLPGLCTGSFSVLFLNENVHEKVYTSCSGKKIKLLVWSM